MSEWFLSLGPVEWFREQFEGCPEDALTCDSISAQELFRFVLIAWVVAAVVLICLLYTSPSPRDLSTSRMPSSA